MRRASFLLGLLYLTLATPLLSSSDGEVGCCNGLIGCENACTTTGNCGINYSTCQPILLPFSQSENAARRFAGVGHLQNIGDIRTFNFHFDFNVEYQQNFDRARMGQYFFPNGTNTILVGEDHTVSGTADVRGSDLGLSESFQGLLTINPQIQNAIFEPVVYVGFDNWVPGLWADMTLPIVYTRWTLDACETNIAPGGSAFTPPSISAPPLSALDTYTVVQNSMKNGGASPSVGAIPSPTVQSDIGVATPVGARSICQAFSGTTWGDKTTPLRAGRIPCCQPSIKTGVADIPVQLGYNFVQREVVYFGLFARAVFPTGRINNQGSIFDATIGYNRWQLGCGAQGRLMLYEKNGESFINFYANMYVTHIFSRSECRVFDMANRGCWSRYLLMKEADANGNYTGKLVNFVDMFTCCVSSRFDWNFDALAYFDIQHKGWNWQFGYEGKARDKEKFGCDLRLCNPCNDSLDCTESSIGTRQYGVKGPQIIGGIGSKVFDAADTTINTFGVQAVPFQTPGGAQIVPLVQPNGNLINAANFQNYINVESAVIPLAVAQKFWSHAGYTWDRKNHPIAVGLGFEIDWGNFNQAPQFWGVWGKFTVGLN